MAIEETVVSGNAAGSMEARGRDAGLKFDEFGNRLSGAIRDKSHGIDVQRHQLQERVGDANAKIVSGAKRGSARIARAVHANPMRSLLWGAGIAAVAGVLLGRRSRRK